MSGLNALLWLTLWGLGPDGPALAEELRSLQNPPLVLPVGGLAETAETLWLVPHEEEEWVFAYYASPQDPATGLLFDKSEEGEPAPAVPRLVLRSSYLEWRGGLGNLPVDLSEYLYNALLDARLETAAASDTEYGKWVDRRAERLFGEVPADYRRQAYLNAVRDFGSHLLSIAHEIRRSATRAEARGLLPCVLLERKVPLLKLWEQSVQKGHYTGKFPRSATSATPQGAAFRIDWQETQKGLEPQDKRIFLEKVLGVYWKGSMKRDFAELCP